MANIRLRRTSRPRTPERIANAIAARGLSLTQRLAIHAIVQTTTTAEALKLLNDRGIMVDRTTLWRWTKNPSFVAARKVAEQALAETISKASVLRKSEAVLEKAMEGTPILGYTGPDTQDIVGYKPDLPSAARMVEMQGKAVGLFQEDVTKVAVLFDVDFSGRKGEPVIEVTPVPEKTLDAEFVDAAIDAALTAPDPSLLIPAEDSWLE